MPQTLRILSSEFLAGRHELMAFVYGLVRDPQAAEDIFQEVWIRLAEAAEQETVADPPRKRALVDCVKGLPEKSRAVLELKYDRGLAGSEVATALGSTYDAVMRMLSRVRKVLVRCVEKKLALVGE